MELIEEDNKLVLRFDDKDDMNKNFVKAVLAINYADRAEKYKALLRNDKNE